jgi:hypothetical protein
LLLSKDCSIKGHSKYHLRNWRFGQSHTFLTRTAYTERNLLLQNARTNGRIF